MSRDPIINYIWGSPANKENKELSKKILREDKLRRSVRNRVVTSIGSFLTASVVGPVSIGVAASSEVIGLIGKAAGNQDIANGGLEAMAIFGGVCLASIASAIFGTYSAVKAFDIHGERERLKSQLKAESLSIVRSSYEKNATAFALTGRFAAEEKKHGHRKIGSVSGGAVEIFAHAVLHAKLLGIPLAAGWAAGIPQRLKEKRYRQIAVWRARREK